MQFLPYLVSLALLVLAGNARVVPLDETLPAEILPSQVAQVAGDAAVQPAPAVAPAEQQSLIAPAPQLVPNPPAGQNAEQGQIQQMPPPTSAGGGGGGGQAQPLRPQMGPAENQNGQPEEVVNPGEILQARREINQMLSDLKRFSRMIKRMPNNSDYQTQIDALSGQLRAAADKLSNSPQSDLREVINDFRDGNYGDEIQKIRAKVEIPSELTQIEKGIKQAKKLISQAAYKKLGINIDMISAKLDEATGIAAKIRDEINNGDLDGANDDMQYFHEGGQPGEITGVLQRLKEITSQLKYVKDQEIKSRIQDILNEIIAAVNSGDFREARETMDQYANGLMGAINQASRLGKKIGGTSGDKVRSEIDNLENLVQQKLNAQQQGRQNQPQAAPFNPFR